MNFNEEIHVVSVHESKKLFQCDECEMLKEQELENSAEDFASEYDLESHRSFHHSEKPFDHIIQVASVHDEKKLSKCDDCEILCNRGKKCCVALSEILKEQELETSAECDLKSYNSLDHSEKSLETAMNFGQEMHVESLHDRKKLFQCDECEMLKDPELENSAEDVANDHLKGHKFEDHLEKPFESSMNQEMEVVTVHEEKKTFLYESLEKGLTPMRDHLITLPFKCSMCGIHFNSKKILDKHILTVHLACYMPMRYGKKLFKCDICSEGFILKQTLELHMLSKHGREQITSVHEGKKQNEAKASRPLKLLKFSKKGNLKSHMSAVHEGTKPLRCKICGAMFAIKGNLKQHMIVHEEKSAIIMNFKGKKRFHCQFCSVKFCVKRMLEKHISVVHEEKKSNEISRTETSMVKEEQNFEDDDDEIPDFD